jgi:hypothetical protein
VTSAVQEPKKLNPSFLFTAHRLYRKSHRNENVQLRLSGDEATECWSCPTFRKTLHLPSSRWMTVRRWGSSYKDLTVVNEWEVRDVTGWAKQRCSSKWEPTARLRKTGDENVSCRVYQNVETPTFDAGRENVRTSSTSWYICLYKEASITILRLHSFGTMSRVMECSGRNLKMAFKHTQCRLKSMWSFTLTSLIHIHGVVRSTGTTLPFHCRLKCINNNIATGLTTAKLFVCLCTRITQNQNTYGGVQLKPGTSFNSAPKAGTPSGQIQAPADSPPGGGEDTGTIAGWVGSGYHLEVEDGCLLGCCAV